MKPTILLLLFFILLTAFSCEKEEPILSCPTGNTSENMDWLQEKILDLELEEDDLGAKYFYIQQAEYKGQVVFIFGNCCPMCNTVVPVYNCQGDLICYLNTNDCPDLQNNLKNIKVIAKGSKNECY